ncbi:putative F-box/LRR-repeat protein at3g44810 [Phtheirospermum japonicum]|uniref:Putative F-box/LRR-repeat protein at3g44810 n=1 Tax=Phtheirospermum japonicum TaxID=374723 RepID=A0A830C0Z5_9LAMI|nr:putative F-box/LRR-repeat protein at3g44810 [Phtheirospermum japonicum]
MKIGSHPNEVQEWCNFGALASVYTIAPSFPEISKLSKWIREAVHETWANNPHLARGDVLELYFISAAPEPAKKGFNEVFHFIKLRRPDGNTLRYIKVASPEDAPVIVGAISEDDASTIRAWGLWVCLTEMDKVKYPFKTKRTFLLNSMTGATTSFAETLFETKRRVLWENRIPVSKDTFRKFCNMAHVGQWIDRICQSCPEQKEPEFEKGFRPKLDRQESTTGKDKRPTGFKKARGPRTMGGDFSAGGVATHLTRDRLGQKEEEGKISKLPDDILHQILSLVDIKQAVQTSVLSKRWRRLCYSLPNLNFDFGLLLTKSSMDYMILAWRGDHPDFMSHFTRFVIQFLSQRDPTSTIHKFCLATGNETTDSTFVEKCIEYAIDHGLRHLDLDARCRPTPFRFPDRLFASETLQVLKVKQYTNNSIVVPKPFIMPNLKTLYLDTFEFGDDISDIYSFSTEPFSGFPSLEELTMFNCQVSGLIIRSAKLRSLEISTRYRKGEMKIEEVSTPRLISFRYQGEVSLVCLKMDLPCLEDVYFDYYPNRFVNKMPANLVRMLQQLGNAKFVTSTFQTIEVLASEPRLLKESPSPFPYMKCLKLIRKQRHFHYSIMETVPQTVMNYLTKGCANGDSLVVKFLYT